MKFSINCFIASCLVHILLFSINVVHAQQQNCQGLEILYPKTDSIIDKTDEQTTYLILGNIASSSQKNVLKEVLILHEKNGNEASKQVWIGQDEISKVSAIQQDLNELDDVPNSYWFRASIEQDGTQCQLESGKFKINKSW